MKFFFFSFLFSSLFHLSVFLNIVNAADPKISYSVSMPFPSNHLFEVTISVQNYSSDNFIDFHLPAWRSGRYVILNFAAGVQDFSAEDENGSVLSWAKTDKDTWRVQGNGSSNYDIKYKVFSNEFHLRSRGLNDERGFIDASAVLMYPEKLRYNLLELNIVPYRGWNVTTGLDNLNGRENVFTARDYDYLADCPIIIGTQKDYEFFVEGKEHTVSFSGEGNYNTDTVTNDLSKIVRTIYDFWGDLPYEHYTFMLQMSTQDFGATEHLNSTIINVHPLIFTNKDRYINFLSTCAHEFFHTWNVKQLRPKGLAPYDFSKENYTEELWIAEGLTSYYENIFLLSAGFLTPEKYFEALAGKIQNDQERPGNYVQSLSESSYDAWIKYNNRTQNKRIAESDFYAKGANVGLLLDLEIRNSSGNKYSLDNVMKTMYANFPLNNGGYTNEDFIKVCEEYGGKSMKEFFDSYLYGLDTLDWKKYLNYAGLNLNITYDEPKPSAGFNTREAGEKLIISYILPGSAAYESGLDIEDEIIAADGYRVRSSTLNNRISEMKDGDLVKLTIMREDRLREINLTLKATKTAKYKIEKIKSPNKLQKKIYEDWLRAEW